MHNEILHQTKEWENACVHTRRDLKKRKKRIKLFDIRKRDKVLDLGCGDGLNIKILRQLGIQDVVGVDISDDLLKLARKNNPKTKFYEGSAEKLPFKSGIFDVIFVDSVFHHLLNYDKAIFEIKRLLKPRGLLCVIEPHKSFFRFLLDALCLLPISRLIPVIKERRKAYLGEIKFMRHWLATEDEFYKKLNENNFECIFFRKNLLSIVAEYKK